MKVLQVFEPPEGGVPEHVLTLTEGLLDRAHVSEVAGPAGGSIRARAHARTAYRALPFVRSYRSPQIDASALRRLHATIRAGRYDVVHAHSAKAGVLARLAAHAAGVPCVYSPHCYGFVGPVSAARRSFAVAVERRLGAVTAHTICCCTSEREGALRNRIVAAEGLTVVHYGVTACDATEPSAELTAFAGGGPLIGAVCALRPQEGIDVLIDAAPAILDACPDARIAIVGNGPMEEQLRRRADTLGLGPRLGFFAFDPPSARHVLALDVFVLPSRWEGLPIAVLEAMACGAAIVASDVDGTGEALRGFGELVPSNDPGTLAAAVVELVRDAARRRDVGRAARTRVQERFTVDRMVEETIAVYERAAA